MFDALADARTYPEWWRHVYIEVEGDGPAEVVRWSGRASLRSGSSATSRTLSPRDGKVHVHFDWRVIALEPYARAQ